MDSHIDLCTYALEDLRTISLLYTFVAGNTITIHATNGGPLIIEGYVGSVRTVTKVSPLLGPDDNTPQGMEIVPPGAKFIDRRKPITIWLG